MKKTILIVVLWFLLIPIIESDAQEYDVEINYVRNDDKSIDFFYTKHVNGAYYLVVKLSKLDNAYSSGYSNEIKGRTGKLFTLKPSSPNRSIGFSYSYRFTRGELKPKYDSTFVYLFPFKSGTISEVRELSNFHTKYRGKELPENWKAYQFSANEWDTVYAARKGRIVKVVDMYDVDTTFTYAMRSKVNYILIEHKDGTIAKYAGFGRGGLLIKEGDRVFPRTPIGILGKYDKTTSQLRFVIYYLSKFDPNDSSEKRVQYGYIQPLFYSINGVRKLVDKEKFISQESIDLIQLEMTKREKKRYKN